MSHDMRSNPTGEPTDEPSEVERLPSPEAALDALSTLVYKARLTARDEPEDSRERVDVKVAHYISVGNFEAAAHFCYATVMAGRKFKAPEADYDTASRYFSEKQPGATNN